MLSDRRASRDDPWLFGWSDEISGPDSDDLGPLLAVSVYLCG